MSILITVIANIQIRHRYKYRQYKLGNPLTRPDMQFNTPGTLHCGKLSLNRDRLPTGTRRPNTRGQLISASIDIGGAALPTFEVVRAHIDIALGTLPVEHFNQVFCISSCQKPGSRHLFYWCGVRQVRFKNRYLTIFHT